MTSNLNTLFDLSLQARIKSGEGKWSVAASLWAEAESLVPQAWWYSMELLRALRCKMPCKPSSDRLILFSPDYTANTYQRNLYSQAVVSGVEVKSLSKLVLDQSLAQDSKARNLIFHQHWIKELYWECVDEKTGRRAINLHISRLQALRAFGAKIVWTLHNLIDHDATEIQERNCLYALGEMARVADQILIHTKGSADALSELLRRDVRSKCMILPHALYSDLLKVAPRMPQEWVEPTGDQFVVLCVGMLRPYKGVAELLGAFTSLITYGKANNLHMVIAGRMLDPQVSEMLSDIPERVRQRLTIIPRVLLDDEIVALVRRADLCVAPYRKILISGSYYLYTTFAKPTLAPQRGMFNEMIKPGFDGYLYDGSTADLANQMAALSRLPRATLNAVGQRAASARSSDTIEAISDRFLALTGVTE